MAIYEYKVTPAPRKGVKAKGVKGADAQFAHALTTLMNEAAAEGWEYIRADTLPMDERQGLTGTKTAFKNMLVFRRATAATLQAGLEKVQAATAVMDPAPEPPKPLTPAPVVAPDPVPAPAPTVLTPDQRTGESKPD